MRFSQACENNKAPILAQLKTAFAKTTKVLEIGSGTGQHAAYFAEHLPHLLWQATDVEENHPSIVAWAQAARLQNVLTPVPFFLGKDQWCFTEVDGIFTANTAHIMQLDEVQSMMQVMAQQLPKGGVFCQYGPFKVDGQFTSASNQEFDLYLKQQGCGGIVDIAQLQQFAGSLVLSQVVEMPANNLMLIWTQA